MWSFQEARRLIDTRLSLAVATTLALIMAGCSPACTDGIYVIRAAPGFFFWDAGGDLKKIVFEGPGGDVTTLIDARVNAYHVDKGRLYASRSPLVIFRDSTTGNLTDRLEPHCEFWSVDIATRVLKQEPEGVQGLRCPPGVGAAAPGAWIAR